MRSGGHHLEPLGSRATLSAVRWVPFHFFPGSPRLEQPSPPPVATPNDAQPGKADWRRDLRSARQALSASQRQQQSKTACDHITPLPDWRDARIIASYFALPEEFDPNGLDEIAREQGKTVVYPRIVGNQLHFHPWLPGEPLEQVAGVKQPSNIHAAVMANQLDLVLVPLVGVDSEGYRLGMGGGYYDQFLPSTHAVRLGVGFSCQRVDKLPHESHDQRLDGFLSGDGLERFGLETWAASTDAFAKVTEQ